MRSVQSAQRAARFAADRASDPKGTGKFKPPPKVMAHPEILISTNRTAALAEHERRLAAGESRSVPEAYYSNNLGPASKSSVKPKRRRNKSHDSDTFSASKDRGHVAPVASRCDALEKVTLKKSQKKKKRRGRGKSKDEEKLSALDTKGAPKVSVAKRSGGSSSPAAEPQSKEKYLRKIKKKLRQIRQLEQKNAEGLELLDAQRKKLASKALFVDELRETLNVLGREQEFEEALSECGFV